MAITSEPEAHSAEDFENVGFAPIKFPRTRRGFLLAGVELFRAVANTSPDRPALRLAALGSMAREQLAEISPAVTPGCNPSLRDGMVWGQPASAEAPIPLLAATGPCLCVFNAMNGMTTLEEIAGQVAIQNGWSDDRAFAFTRGVFLHLVGLRVCIPATRG